MLYYTGCIHSFIQGQAFILKTQEDLVHGIVNNKNSTQLTSLPVLWAFSFSSLHTS